MKILLIEDEKLAAEKLHSLLIELDTEIEIVGQQDSVDGTIHWLNNNPHPDLILSDIHLTDGLCFSIYSQVKVDCPIIFTTAYDKYALQAFEVNSIDYLLKPIQKERLSQALDKYNTLSNTVQDDRGGLYSEFQQLLAKRNRDYKSRFLKLYRKYIPTLRGASNSNSLLQ